MLEPQMLIAKAKEARLYAYAPYSKFKVGAALEGKSGNIYTGCNIENQAYGSTMCAERVSLFKGISEGEKKFVQLAIVADVSDYCYPCGDCRQVMMEFSPQLKVIMGNLEGKFIVRTITELLPLAFDWKGDL